MKESEKAEDSDYIRNPQTGRYVLKTGDIGQRIIREQQQEQERATTRTESKSKEKSKEKKVGVLEKMKGYLTKKKEVKEEDFPKYEIKEKPDSLSEIHSVETFKLAKKKLEDEIDKEKEKIERMIRAKKYKRDEESIRALNFSVQRSKEAVKNLVEQLESLDPNTALYVNINDDIENLIKAQEAIVEQEAKNLQKEIDEIEKARKKGDYLPPAMVTMEELENIANLESKKTGDTVSESSFLGNFNVVSPVPSIINIDQESIISSASNLTEKIARESATKYPEEMAALMATYIEGARSGKLTSRDVEKAVRDSLITKGAGNDLLIYIQQDHPENIISDSVPENVGPNNENIKPNNENIGQSIAQQTNNVTESMSATASIYDRHPPKYHLIPILFMFGRNTVPMNWDFELENNVFESGLESKERIEYMNAIIANYGSIMFVKERKSDSLDELNELIQMQYCIIRNLQRGPRFAQASVPISSLVNFANKLGTPSNNQTMVDNQSMTEEQRNDFIQPQQDNEVISNLQDTVIVENPQQQQVNDTVVQLVPNKLEKKLEEDYANNFTTPNGKYIFNENLSKQTLVNHGILYGPGDIRDPAQNTYSPYNIFSINVAPKRRQGIKTKDLLSAQVGAM